MVDAIAVDLNLAFFYGLKSVNSGTGLVFKVFESDIVYGKAKLFRLCIEVEAEFDYLIRMLYLHLKLHWINVLIVNLLALGNDLLLPNLKDEMSQFSFEFGFSNDAYIPVS